jgi:hypothetical protein
MLLLFEVCSSTIWRPTVLAGAPFGRRGAFDRADRMPPSCRPEIDAALRRHPASVPVRQPVLGTRAGQGGDSDDACITAWQEEPGVQERFGMCTGVRSGRSDEELLDIPHRPLTTTQTERRVMRSELARQRLRLQAVLSEPA